MKSAKLNLKSTKNNLRSQITFFFLFNNKALHPYASDVGCMKKGSKYQSGIFCICSCFTNSPKDYVEVKLDGDIIEKVAKHSIYRILETFLAQEKSKKPLL